MRCNAPLDTGNAGDAVEATIRDPQAGSPQGGAPGGGGVPGGSPDGGGVPVPFEPAPPPWADQNPVQWESPPDYTTPMPPSDEQTTHLSPEPWSEPAIWQPPAPPKRSMLPYFLAAAGAVLLIGLAAAIVFWPSGSDESPPAASQPSAAQSQGAPPETESAGTETGTGDLAAQAGAIDKLLDDMGSTRSDLGGVVTQGCPVAGIQRVLDARRGQLSKAQSLDVSALDNGTPMKDALVRALQASTESNQRYLDIAPGCPSEGEVSDVNSRASDAKGEFLGYWAPVAAKAGLSPRTESDI
ncbi:hypothetical protein E1293_29370 [Actinomadura darangshiensis]|uniref:Uncharacterized protein n=1 Tax=Actinomadura darangshiensis TaxID=705336 RepID=A0A4R5AQU9_9ACTN|nr:hypothetical protein [Actinomadura darangshiensis]TDD74565.1 hypothetical protein E1293_29370 [Actinomadura darangshiensis]